MRLADMCEAGAPDPDETGVWVLICKAPATALHRYGCLHEHVTDKQTCDLHAPRPGKTGCQQCYDAGHYCDMAFTLLARTAGIIQKETERS
jgi:hypothetical protein